jgi:beta-1,4-mannosyltransferase
VEKISVCIFPNIDQEKNGYLKSLNKSLGADLVIQSSSWSNMLLSDFEILNIHWPEYLYRGQNKLQTFMKVFLTFVLLSRCAIQKRKIVLTMHNLRPHENTSRLSFFMNKVLSKSAASCIYLNQTDTLNERDCYIPLGHYKSESNSLLGKDVSTKYDLLFFGQIRPYKNLELLIDCIGELPEFDIGILGLPINDAYAKVIKNLGTKFPNIHLDFGWIPDEKLVASIRNSEVVILPYQEIYNSEAVIFALSLGKPVIVSKSVTMQALQEEVGLNWLYIYEQPLTALTLEKTIERVHLDSANREGQPNFFPEREWDVIRDRYLNLFKRISQP